MGASVVSGLGSAQGIRPTRAKSSRPFSVRLKATRTVVTARLWPKVKSQQLSAPLSAQADEQPPAEECRSSLVKPVP